MFLKLFKCIVPAAKPLFVDMLCVGPLQLHKAVVLTGCLGRQLFRRNLPEDMLHQFYVCKEIEFFDISIAVQFVPTLAKTSELDVFRHVQYSLLLSVDRMFRVSRPTIRPNIIRKTVALLLLRNAIMTALT